MGNYGSETWYLLKRTFLREAATPDEISFVHDSLEMPNGKLRDYYFMDCPYSVVMVAAVHEGKIALIRQHRYLFDEVLFELPAGSPEGEESLEDGAKRELLEEAGLVADHLEKLGTFYPAVGITNQDLTIYLAAEVRFTSAAPDEGENIAVEWIDIEDARKMVLEGQIKNESSAMGILLAAGVS